MKIKELRRLIRDYDENCEIRIAFMDGDKYDYIELSISPEDVMLSPQKMVLVGNYSK